MIFIDIKETKEVAYKYCGTKAVYGDNPGVNSSTILSKGYLLLEIMGHLVGISKSLVVGEFPTSLCVERPMYPSM